MQLIKISQVLLAFGASAYFTLIFCTAYDLLNYEHASNPIDRQFVEAVPSLWGRKCSRPSAKWSKAIQNAVLISSDQQVVTGLSILVSGYSQLTTLTCRRY